MANETVAAGSSPAEEADVFGGEHVSLSEFSHYRQSGELPERFKPAEDADTAPDDAPEETVDDPAGEEPESDPDSEPEEDQEPPQKGSGAEKRIKQLLAKVKELERNQAAKPDAAAESSPTQQPAYTRPKPTAEDKGPDGNLKYSTYEDFVEALSDWNADKKIAQYKQEQVQQGALNALKVKMDEARSRYEDADETIFPAAKTINEAKIPLAVKEVFAQSDLFIDLCYVVGSDPAELKKFVSLAQSNPREAIGKVFEYERGIREELGKTESSGKAPEPKKTSAPRPPAPVGGASSRAFDVSDESLSPEQWAQKRTADLAKRGKR